MYLQIFVVINQVFKESCSHLEEGQAGEQTVTAGLVLLPNARNLKEVSK